MVPELLLQLLRASALNSSRSLSSLLDRHHPLLEVVPLRPLHSGASRERDLLHLGLSISATHHLVQALRRFTGSAVSSPWRSASLIEPRCTTTASARRAPRCLRGQASGRDALVGELHVRLRTWSAPSAASAPRPRPRPPRPAIGSTLADRSAPVDNEAPRAAHASTSTFTPCHGQAVKLVDSDGADLEDVVGVGR